MENSHIEWTDHTFNPWIGCTKVSPGCQHCYAEVYGNRFGVRWGPQGERRRTSEDYWSKPRAWNRRAAKTGKPETVFCASLADWAEDRPELIPWRNDFFALTEETQNLIYLMLTKRPENIRQFWPWLWSERRANVWFGTSVESQNEGNKRVIDLLYSVHGPKFLSCEPLLGPVDLTSLPAMRGNIYDALTGREWTEDRKHSVGFGPSIKWVICGGESGPNARPTHPDWVRSLRDQCAEAGVPFFFKQWGAWSPCEVNGAETMIKIGKKLGGRLLDGVLHDAKPEELG